MCSALMVAAEDGRGHDLDWLLDLAESSVSFRSRYLAAPVWLGFIFLLDPINARLGGESLWIDMRAGRYERLVNLSLSGFLCGALWEFWNFWAGAKWHYSVPIMERWKIFEMPLPGYFGFAPFAVECFTMYVFVRRMFAKLGRRVADS